MSEQAGGAGKGLMSSALLVGAVGLILLAGWMLKGDPADRAPRAAAAAQAPALGSSIAAEPVPAESVDAGDAEPEAEAEPGPEPERVEDEPPRTDPPSEDPVLVRLATRAEADSARLARARGRWTAQLLVACKIETVERVLAASSGTPHLYLLPARVRDEACFRVCYGVYPGQKDAASAADLPAALKSGEKVAAVEIAKVLP